jgi:hypothetical protein
MNSNIGHISGIPGPSAKLAWRMSKDLTFEMMHMILTNVGKRRTVVKMDQILELEARLPPSLPFLYSP